MGAKPPQRLGENWKRMREFNALGMRIAAEEIRRTFEAARLNSPASRQAD